MQKTRVLHIITRLDKGGSAENTFLNLVGLDKRRYDVTLMSGPVEDPAQDRRKELEKYGIKHIVIPELVRDISLINDLKAMLKIYKALRKENIDIVHTHTSKAGLLGRLAARRARIPVIIHTPHGHVFFGYFGPLKSKIFIFLEKGASRITDKIIALTNREKEDYISYKVIDEDRCVIIFSGIVLDKFRDLTPEEKQNMKKELGIPENSLIIGTGGRLVPVKGPEFLIDAAELIISKYPDTFFILAGDGYLRQNLEKKAFDLGLKENIIFLGWRDDSAKIYSLIDVFVLPSLNEGMGRVLIEAMALGKPIVASRIGGIPDLVSHGKNGFLVPPKNPEELAKYIQILIEDKEKRDKMGLIGKEIAKNFSVESMVKKIEKLYEELLKELRN